MGTPFAVTAANAFMYYHERDIIALYSRNLTLYKRFIDDVFVIWEGPRDTLLEFLSAINTKDERIKITYEISDSKISFLDLLLFKDPANNTCNTLPFRNRLISIYICHTSYFTPLVTKKLLSKASSCAMPEIARLFAHSMRQVNYSGSACALRGYPARFLLSVFREINYSNRSKWFSKPRRLSRHRTVVFKSTYNCSHVGIKNEPSFYC